MSTSEKPSFEVCQKCGAAISLVSGKRLCPACLLRRLEAPDIQSPTLPVSVEGYRLIRQVGRGGMGSVWLAVRENDGREVAIKFLLSGALADARERERFSRESEAIQRLKHPNIVPLYESGEQAGHSYLVLEYVAGSTLAATLALGPLEPTAAATLFCKAGDALAHAHHRGVVHRDLKPGNILLDLLGEPHVTDFGLARFGLQDSDLTFTHEMLGTPAYSAPESLLGGPRRAEGAAGSADIYGLGAVLYHCLTGRPPAIGENAAEILRAAEEVDPPRPGLLRSGVPRELEVICLKCLEKRPEDRYGTARDAVDDVERWMRGEAIRARPPTWMTLLSRRVQRHKLVSGLVAVILLILVASGFVTLRQIQLTFAANQELKDRDLRQNLELADSEMQRGDARRGLMRLAGQSRRYDPDGITQRKIAAALSELSWLVPDEILGDDSRRASAVRFSHDGTLLLTLSAHEPGNHPKATLWEIEPETVPPRIKAEWPVDIGEIYEMQFSDDDTQVTFWAKGARARRTDLTGITLPGQVTAQRPPEPEERKNGEYLSPDEARMVEAHANGFRGNKLSLYEMPERKLLRSFPEEAIFERAVWKEDDSSLFLSVEAGILRLRKSEWGELACAEFNCGGVIEDVQWSPDGERIAVAPFNSAVLLLKLLPKDEVLQTKRFTNALRGVQWSPDGRTLAGSGWRTEGFFQAVDRRNERYLAGKPLFVGYRPYYTKDSGVIGLNADGTMLFKRDAESEEQVQLGRVTGDVSHAGFGRHYGVVVINNTWLQIFDTTKTNQNPPLIEIPLGKRGLWNQEKVMDASGNWDETLIGVASTRSVAAVFGIPEMKLQYKFEGDAPFTSIRFSSDGSRVAAGNMNGIVILANARTGEPIGPPLPHDDYVVAVEFTRDGSRLGTVSDDGKFRIWDSRTGGLLAVTVTDRSIRTLVHRASGREFVTGASDGSIRRYDDRFATIIGTGLSLEPTVQYMTASPVGGEIAIIGEKGILGLLAPASIEQKAPEWLLLLADALTGERIAADSTIEKQPIRTTIALRKSLSAVGVENEGLDRLRSRFLKEH